MAVLPIALETLHSPSPEQLRDWCAQLEAGDILYFPQTPITIPESDLQFLLGQQQADSSLHKNIAYKPNIDKLSGVDTGTADAQAVARLQAIMRHYSQSVTGFLTSFLAPYNANWQLDYASFRPQEEEGRDLPQRRRNDLLHTDAFPTRPTYGARILRFFSNIHPSRTRDWIVSDPFATIVKQFAPVEIAPHVDGVFSRAAKALGRGIGLGARHSSIKRSPYDDFMMRFHNFLKENPGFQSSAQGIASTSPRLQLDGLHRHRSPRRPGRTVRTGTDIPRPPRSTGNAGNLAPQSVRRNRRRKPDLGSRP